MKIEDAIHYCGCGCGRKTKLNKWNKKYAKFIFGHSANNKTLDDF